MKKFFALLITILMVFALTGCMFAETTTTINADGTGKVVSKSGVAEDVYKEMGVSGSSYGKRFTDGGITYFGSEETVTFNNPKEMNFAQIESESGSSSYVGLFTQDLDGNYYIALNLGTAMAEEGMDQENLDSLNELIESGLKIKENYNLPDDVRQIQGKTDGVTVKGHTVKVDLVEYLKNNISSISDSTSFKNGVLIFTTAPKNAHSHHFTDVTEGAWYFPAVEMMASACVVNGMGNNLFAPEDTLTVAQYCQILANYCSLKTGSEDGYWATAAIRSCVNAGIIDSHGDITPAVYDVPITRDEAIAGMYRTFANTGRQVNHSYGPRDIPDYAKINQKYAVDILNAYNCDLCTGVDANLTFGAGNHLSRAQMCQLIYNT